MKSFCIKSMKIASDPVLCERFLDEALASGFELIKIASFGRFYFTYTEKQQRYSYYCFADKSSMFFGSALRSLNNEVRRVFYSGDVLNTSMAVKVMRLERRAKKTSDYLNNISKSHDLGQFSEPAYIEYVKKNRNYLFKRGNLCFGIIMLIFAIMFIAFGIFSVPWTALIAVIPALLSAGAFRRYFINSKNCKADQTVL